MTLEQLQIVFYGVEALALLFGLYGLYEWGLYLIGRVKGGTLALSKAQTWFSIPAAVLSFVPMAIMSAALRMQPFGEVMLFDMAQASTVFMLFGSLFLGFVIQGMAVGVFWYFTRSFKK